MPGMNKTVDFSNSLPHNMKKNLTYKIYIYIIKTSYVSRFYISLLLFLCIRTSLTSIHLSFILHLAKINALEKETADLICSSNTSILLLQKDICRNIEARNKEEKNIKNSSVMKNCLIRNTIWN